MVYKTRLEASYALIIVALGEIVRFLRMHRGAVIVHSTRIVIIALTWDGAKGGCIGASERQG